VAAFHAGGARLSVRREGIDVAAAPRLTTALRQWMEHDSGYPSNWMPEVIRMLPMSFDQERAVASLAGLFGIVALALAAVGLYGVTAYTLAQRTNEIGIRMALGADHGKVIDLVLRGAFKRVVAGLILGLPLALAPDA